jgi:hexosaminidase
MTFLNRIPLRFGSRYKFLLLTLIILICILIVQSYYHYPRHSASFIIQNVNEIKQENNIPKLLVRDNLLGTIKQSINEQPAKFHSQQQQEQLNEQKQQTKKPVDPNDVVGLLGSLEKLVHIDLKGAPPKPEFFKDFIPFLKNYGATGLILEYEDMFPFKGNLESVKHGNAYSYDTIKMINQLAKDNNLKLMPLVQTYGHLEWLLKNKKFEHLRDNHEYPQVITPCLDESYNILFGNFKLSSYKVIKAI